MPTIDDLRAAGESQLQEILARLDRRHRALLQAAIEEYGNVRDIPEEFWEEMRRDIEEEETAALLLLIVAADEWTTEEIGRQGLQGRSAPLPAYAIDAARSAQASAAQTVDTLRSRLERKVGDVLASPAGGLGRATSADIRQTLDDVFTPQRRGTIATDLTTGAFSTGQIGARDRIGGDGASTADGQLGQRGAAGRGGGGGDGASTDAGQRVSIELYWVTESDDRVCPRCAPLHDQPESVWGLVFRNGPGPEAHPNCRCNLRPVVVVQSNQDSA